MPEIQIIPNFFDDKEENSLSILRLDLPDPLTCGNKIYKMKYNLEEMKSLGLNRVITFGGAFSNHIAATATVGNRNGFETIGIIRGDELNENSNRVMRHVSSCGMKLIFVSREEYRKRYDAEYCEMLVKKYGPAYLLPEGGSNKFAIRGCKEILSDATDKYDMIFSPVGTGGTLSGIIAAAKAHQQVVGIAVLKGKNYLEGEVEKYLKRESFVAKWKIEHDFTLGGYGKSSLELQHFIREMKSKFDLPLDHVYSGKTLFAISQIKKRDAFRGKHLLFVHTAGYAFSQ